MITKNHKIIVGRKFLETKTPASAGVHASLRRDWDSNSGAETGYKLAICCITTLPPLQKTEIAFTKSDCETTQFYSISIISSAIIAK